MSQHDFNIANQGFPATRADINNAFQAIASNSSGPTAPSTTYANQWWYDTTNDKMYLRNAADSAWIEVAVIDQTNNEWQITTGVVQAKDSDGLALKTDDGTTRLFIKDSDGNVGIGTTSPSNKLEVLTDGGGQLKLLAWDLSSTAENDIDFWYLDAGGSPYQNAQISAVAAANAGNGSLVFSTRPTSGSLTERMRITADGYVTTPNQPAFHAYGGGNKTSDGIVVFSTANVNQSNSYNTSNGRFTAPVDGTYKFTARLMKYATSGDSLLDFHFRVNGTQYVNNLYDNSAPSGKYNSGSIGRIVTLNSGDYVEVYTASTSATNVVYQSHREFTGFLIG